MLEEYCKQNRSKNLKTDANDQFFTTLNYLQSSTPPIFRCVQFMWHRTSQWVLSTEKSIQWRRQDLVRGWHRSRRPEGEEGVSLSPLGVGSGEGAIPPPQKKILNFYIKMVSSGAFWVAISYRLAACFTGIGSTRAVEIYWRSFRHFGNYNYSLMKTGQKNDKNGPKIDKNCAKIAFFLYIVRICSLKILYWTENRAHDSSESVKWVIPKITSWKSRGGGTCPSAP